MKSMVVSLIFGGLLGTALWLNADALSDVRRARMKYEEQIRAARREYEAAVKEAAKQALREEDVRAATQIDSLLKAFANETVPPPPMLDTKSAREAVLNPLTTELRRHWKQGGQEFTLGKTNLVGVGRGDITLEMKFKARFRLDFNIVVRDGTRPRVRFGKLWFGNEGYERTFALYPDRPKMERFAYVKDQPYAVSLVFHPNQVVLYVDGRLVDQAPGEFELVDGITFSCGDGWSAGKVEFSNLRIALLP